MIRYIHFFAEHSLFNDNQYSFKSGHLTEYAIMEVIDRTITALDSNETPINIFLDLSKAFDTLDHNILLNKLHTYGICDIALELMESYLKNRNSAYYYRCATRFRNRPTSFCNVKQDI